MWKSNAGICRPSPHNRLAGLNMDSYDEIPYESTPLHETHPEFLATLAQLFGFTATPPENCRVLEIGCASGGNLIPMACEYPHSYFLGIELSARQAEDGSRLIKDLGLGNIEIRQCDLLAFPADEGKFDYIIAHGLYSWVPQQVREKLLQVCRTHLSDNGIAYVSYNTLPGWHTRSMLRDMLLFHTRHATTATHKLQQAQSFLTQLETALPESEEITGRVLQEELRRIHRRHPSYLFHEYLETTNQPFLFSDVIAECARYGLGYIADIDLISMFPSSSGDNTEAMLEPYQDMIDVWQYMDFLSGRTFRQSLLCLGTKEFNGDIDLTRFSRFAFFSDLAPEENLVLPQQKTTFFSNTTGRSIEVSHPLTQAALLYLYECYPDAVNFADLNNAAKKPLLAVGDERATEQEAMLNDLFWLYSKQLINCRTTPIHFFGTVSERPKANRLARAEHSAGRNQVTTAHHGSLQLDPFSAILLTCLDGEHQLDEIIQILTTAMQEGGLQNLPGYRPPNDAEELHHLVTENCLRILSIFARNGVLVA